MNIYRYTSWCWQYSWGTICTLTVAGLISPPALSQLIPDNSLGTERSRVIRNVQVRGDNADLIEDGARRGANLFQSFSEFNVNEQQRVYFAKSGRC